MKHLQIFILVLLMATPSFSQEDNWSYPLMTVRNYDINLNQICRQSRLYNVNQSGEKKAGKAFFYSLVLPGMGEAYVGRTGYTKFFLTVEALAWGMLVANHFNVTWQTKDYRNYAVQHAGVNPDAKDKDYWINVGYYYSIYAYNEQKRRDRNIEAIYEENAFYTWQWDTEENRKYYAVKRAETREMEGRAVYFMGAIVLNHLVSAINAMRLTRHYNKQEKLSWHLNCRYNPINSRLMLSYTKTL
jgi:hypothetical protein